MLDEMLLTVMLKHSLVTSVQCNKAVVNPLCISFSLALMVHTADLMCRFCVMDHKLC